MLVSPDSSATGISTSPTLRWSPSVGTESYSVQLSDTADFSRLIVDEDSVGTTSFNVIGLSNDVTYYWRINAENGLGASDWSEVWSFTTVINLPTQVILVLPDSGAVISTDSAVFVWQQSRPEVDQYWFELIMPKGSQIDSTTIDTSTVVYSLINGGIYEWKVRAHNAAGWGEFSDVWRFSVLITGVGHEEETPTVFSLSQNYPNPFNPTTTIRYGLPQRAHVRLEVFNLLGQQDALLVDEEKEAGWHEVLFENPALGSGVYFCRISTSNYVQIRKLMLLR